MADVILRAQNGLPELMGFGAAVLVALAVWAAWVGSMLWFYTLSLMAGLTFVELYYDSRWTLEFGRDGLHLRRWGPDRFVPWDDVAFVRADPSWAENRSTTITVAAKRGTPSPELRFGVSRLSPQDRRRLGDLFADRGHPLRVGP